MLLGYAQNHTGGKYIMFIMHTKSIILRRDVVWINKTYGQQVLRKENTKPDTYILQDEDNLYSWDHVKIDPDKNKVKIENLKTEENVNTKQDSRGEEDVQKTIKSVYFAKQENQVKQYHHGYIDKNVVQELKKLDTTKKKLIFLTNPTTSSIIWKYKTCHKKSQLYNKSTLTLVCFCQNTKNYRTSKNCGITKIHKKAKAGVRPSGRNSRA